MPETKPKPPEQQTVDRLVQSLLTISPKYGSLRLGLYVESALANSQTPKDKDIMARAIETSVSKYIELAARREISSVELSFALDGSKTVQPVIWFVENGKAFVYDPLRDERFKPSEFKPFGGRAYVLEVVARWTREEPPFLKFADANNPVEQLKKRFGIVEARAQTVYGKLEQIRALLGRDRVLFYSGGGAAMRLAETASKEYGAKFGMEKGLDIAKAELKQMLARREILPSRGGVRNLLYYPELFESRIMLANFVKTLDGTPYGRGQGRMDCSSATAYILGTYWGVPGSIDTTGEFRRAVPYIGGNGKGNIGGFPARVVKPSEVGRDPNKAYIWLSKTGPSHVEYARRVDGAIVWDGTGTGKDRRPWSGFKSGKAPYRQADGYYIEIDTPSSRSRTIQA